MMSTSRHGCQLGCRMPMLTKSNIDWPLSRVAMSLSTSTQAAPDTRHPVDVSSPRDSKYGGNVRCLSRKILHDLSEYFSVGVE
jgi:hypothetical protein